MKPDGRYRIYIGSPEDGVPLRRENQVRDSFLLLLPGTTLLVAYLVRAPVISPVAENVLRYGEGALNVDACRVAADLSEFFSATGRPRSGMGHAHGFGMGEGYGGDAANPPHPGGRWPSNLLLVHAPDCTRLGSRKVQGHRGYPNGPGGKSMQYTSGKRGADVRPNAWKGHAHEDGTEDAPVWSCVSSCPVASLDEMSGVRASGGRAADPLGGRRGLRGNILPHRADAPFSLPDVGTASRFFPQFTHLSEAFEWLSRLVSA